MPEIDAKTPETSRSVKAVAAALAAVVASAGLYAADALLSGHRASPVTMPPSAAAVAHHAPPEPVLSRLQVERIAERAAAQAAARVEATSEERRGHDREMLAARLAVIQQRLESVAQAVDRLAAQGRRR